MLWYRYNHTFAYMCLLIGNVFLRWAMWSMSLNQVHVVHFYQCLFTNFQILFLCTQYTLRCLIFSKQFWIIDKWSYFTVKQTNETQYVYGYICLLLEKYMAKSVRTISWKYKASFKYDFEWWMNKRDYNSWKYFICCFLKQISSLFAVVYKRMSRYYSSPQSFGRK